MTDEQLIAALESGCAVRRDGWSIEPTIVYVPATVYRVWAPDLSVHVHDTPQAALRSTHKPEGGPS